MLKIIIWICLFIHGFGVPTPEWKEYNDNHDPAVYRHVISTDSHDGIDRLNINKDTNGHLTKTQ